MLPYSMILYLMIGFGLLILIGLFVNRQYSNAIYRRTMVILISIIMIICIHQLISQGTLQNEIWTIERGAQNNVYKTQVDQGTTRLILKDQTLYAIEDADRNRFMVHGPKVILKDVNVFYDMQDKLLAYTTTGDLYGFESEASQSEPGLQVFTSKPKKLLSNVKQVSVFPAFVLALTNTGDLYKCRSAIQTQIQSPITASEAPSKIASHIKTLLGQRDPLSVSSSNAALFVTKSNELMGLGEANEGEFGNATLLVLKEPKVILPNVKEMLKSQDIDLLVNTFPEFDQPIIRAAHAAITTTNELVFWGKLPDHTFSAPTTLPTTLEQVQIFNILRESKQFVTFITEGLGGISNGYVSGQGAGLGAERFAALSDGKIYDPKQLYIKLTKNGSLYAYGTNQKGLMGNGEITSKAAKTPYLILSDVQSIRVENNTLFATKNDGKVFAWGDREGIKKYGIMFSDGKPYETKPIEVNVQES